MVGICSIADSLFLNVNNESKLTDLGLAITINLVNKKLSGCFILVQFVLSGYPGFHCLL
jgi:hypothetical protein